MSRLESVRCSSLPLGFICGGSLRSDTGVLVDPYNIAADDGDDAHRLLAMYPDGDAQQSLLGELSDDARIVYFTCAKAWRENISAWMPDSEPEVFFDDGGGLTGHIDRLSVDLVRGTATVLDWKTGRKDHSYKHQGFGYASKVFRSYRSLSTVTVHFYWARTDELESYTVSKDRNADWEIDLNADVINWDGVYHPGEHCNGCKRSTTCPARAQTERQALALLGQTVSLASMDGPAIFNLHAKAKMVARTIETLEEAIRAEARARGSIEDGNGNIMHFVPSKGPRKVDALKAWPALQARLTDEEIASCVRVSIGDAEALVGEKAKNAPGAKRGAIKAAKEDLSKALAEAGAVSQADAERFAIERKG